MHHRPGAQTKNGALHHAESRRAPHILTLPKPGHCMYGIILKLVLTTIATAIAAARSAAAVAGATAAAIGGA